MSSDGAPGLWLGEVKAAIARPRRCRARRVARPIPESDDNELSTLESGVGNLRNALAHSQS
jgi:hypothetical protein